MKICILKLVILVPETFAILPGNTEKGCGKAVARPWSQTHCFPGLQPSTQLPSSAVFLVPNYPYQDLLRRTGISLVAQKFQPPLHYFSLWCSQSHLKIFLPVALHVNSNSAK